VAPAPRAESQEQILQAAVDSLTAADIPPDEQDGWAGRRYTTLPSKHPT
jgi:hypothetical protein